MDLSGPGGWPQSNKEPVDVVDDNGLSEGLGDQPSHGNTFPGGQSEAWDYQSEALQPRPLQPSHVDSFGPLAVCTGSER